MTDDSKTDVDFGFRRVGEAAAPHALRQPPGELVGHALAAVEEVGQRARERARGRAEVEHVQGAARREHDARLAHIARREP